MTKKFCSFYLCFFIIISLFTICSSAQIDKDNSASLGFGEKVSEIKGSKIDPSFKYASADEMIADMSLVSKNKNFALYFSEKNLAFGVVDLKSGAIHLSNPYDASFDSNYIGSGEQRLDSQIVLYYVNSSSKTDYLYSSTDCSMLGQYKVRLFENGIKIDYSIGEEFEQPIYPQVMSVSYFKKVTASLDAEDKETVKGYYNYIDIDEIDDNNRKKWLRDTYPLLDSEPLYIAPTDLYQREQHNLSQVFEKAGYTKEQFFDDSEKYGFELEINKYPNFKLTLEILLSEEGLKLNIPYNSIKSSNETFNLQSIDLLPYFLSDVKGEGEAYLFVPDGAGAIYDINNLSEGNSVINKGVVYGDDVSNVISDNSNKLQYYLPVYGIVKNNGSGIFSVIESGSEMSVINTRIKAHGTRYSYVNNAFNYSSNTKIVKDTQKQSEGSSKTIYYFDKKPHNQDFTVFCYFLSGENANYSGMANIYREKLLKDKQLKEDFKDLNLVLETVGSALYEDDTFSIPISKEATFTTYEQNAEILEYFNKAGIKNTSLVISGWQKGGLETSLNKKIKFSSSLGGKSEFKQLVKDADKFSTNLFVQQNVAYVSNDATFDSFIKNSHTARCLDYSLSTFLSGSYNEHLYKSGALTVTSSKYSDFLTPFFKSMNSYNVKGAELTAFGRNLNSNFNENKHKSNRSDSKNAITEILRENCGSNNVSVDGANAYVLPYTDMVRNIPVSSGSSFENFTGVPFLQLVLSGKVMYTSAPMNIEYDFEDIMLSCIETATAPAFLLIYDESQILKVEEYTHFYDCVFENKKEWITSVYKYIEKALSVTENSAFVKHEYVESNLTLSYFENGSVICVNHSSLPKEYNGITVNGNNYAVVSTGDNKDLKLYSGSEEELQTIIDLKAASSDSNKNFYNKYNNAGHKYMELGHYKKAMLCFEIIGDDLARETAFEAYRMQILTQKWYFFWPIVVLIFAAVTFLIVLLVKRISKTNKLAPSGKLIDEFLYGFYILIHPFKGFYALKHQKRGSIKAATVWLAIGSVCAIFSVIDQSYFYGTSEFSVMTSLANTLFPLLLWCVANMCFTTLMNGKGTFKQVYTAIGYASIPYTLISIPCTLLSTVMITGELVYLSYVGTFATSLVLILIFIGMMKTHDYSFFKNLIVTIFTIIGMAFILFLIFVFVGLVFRMTATVVNMVYEIIYRM